MAPTCAEIYLELGEYLLLRIDRRRAIGQIERRLLHSPGGRRNTFIALVRFGERRLESIDHGPEASISWPAM